MSYDVADLKDRADLAREVADRVGSGKVSGKTITYPCPNPSHSDTHPSFTVDTVAQRFRCWSQCGKGGDVIDLVEWLDGLSTADAIEYLGQKYRANQQSRDEWARTAKRPAPSKPAPKLVTRAEDKATPLDGDSSARILARFIESRGWSADTAQAVGLSVVRDSKGAARVRFPFLKDGEPLVWQDRATQDGQLPKWLTPKGATLYPFGIDCLDRYDLSPDLWPKCPIASAPYLPNIPTVVGIPAVWIVEGPADAVTLLNLWPSLSVLGCPGVDAWKSHYTRALEGLSVVVVTDNDTSGENLRAVLDEELADLAAVVHVWVPRAYNDLGEWALALGPDTFREALAAVTRVAVADLIESRSVTA
jgi:DNA primase